MGLTMIVGPEASGKSALLSMLAAERARAGGAVIIIDADRGIEGLLRAQMEGLGEAIILHPTPEESIEAATEAMRLMAGSKEGPSDAILLMDSLDWGLTRAEHMLYEDAAIELTRASREHGIPVLCSCSSSGTEADGALKQACVTVNTMLGAGPGEEGCALVGFRALGRDGAQGGRGAWLRVESVTGRASVVSP